MQRSLFVSLMLAGVLAGSVGEAADRPAKPSDEPLETRVYPVADLLVPLPGPMPPADLAEKKFEQEFTALEQHLRRITGPEPWKAEGVIKPYAKTLSLVIRQSATVHERIADELNRLRRELDVQAVLAFHVITGPRDQIAALADAFPGELGQFETEQLLKRANESQTMKMVIAPRITLVSPQTAQVFFDGRTIAAHATVSDDRRSIRVKVSEGAEKGNDLLANTEIVRIHSGRSVVQRFEAPKVGGVIPPAPDATERLLVLTASVLIANEAEEKKEQQSITFTATPRFIIQEEEETLLGLPVE